MDSKYEVIFSEKVDSQIDNALDYIRVNLSNPTAAKKLHEKINDNVKYLKISPYLFPVSRIEGCRQCPVDNYLLFFEIDESQKHVNVLYFYHGSQDYEALWK